MTLYPLTVTEETLMMSIDMSRDDMLSALREGVVSLSFEKVKDGLIREMKATLVSDRIPADKMPKGFV